MDFYRSFKYYCRRLHHRNPVFGLALGFALLVLAFMVVITLAPLILEFLAVLILLMLVGGAIYWIAAKTGFIEE